MTVVITRPRSYNKEDISLSIYKQQKEQIRNQIIETSVSLFKENGYDSVTVSEITMKIGIAKGTFYNFFSSKRDVLMIWSLQQFQKLKMEDFINKEKTIEENLNLLIETVYQLIRNEQKIFRI
jgi:AcrR family transcriptional regulator